MPLPLLVLPPLLIGAVLIASGGLKAVRAVDLAELETLGLPAVLRRAWLARAHPWTEIALGVALVLLGGVLGALAALAATVLMGAYLVLVARAVRTRPGSSCSCFGAPRPLTRGTIVRNAWLTALAVAALAVSGRTPLWGGPVALLDGAGWLWALGAVLAAVTALMIAAPGRADAADDGSAPGVTAVIDEDADYLRMRTPALPLQLADGTETTLRALGQQRPFVTLAVREGCGSCHSTLQRVPAWRALLPEVDIRLLIEVAPDQSGLTELTEPQSLHDTRHLVGESLGYGATPTAVLYGMDGLLAGGPVSGADAVAEFIDDVYESLHGERPGTAVTAAQE